MPTRPETIRRRRTVKPWARVSQAPKAALTPLHRNVRRHTRFDFWRRCQSRERDSPHPNFTSAASNNDAVLAPSTKHQNPHTRPTASNYVFMDVFHNPLSINILTNLKCESKPQFTPFSDAKPQNEPSFRRQAFAEHPQASQAPQPLSLPNPCAPTDTTDVSK